MEPRFKLADRFSHLKGNMWSDLMELNAKYSPINMAQGAPDYAAPNEVLTSLSAVVAESNDNASIHQYAPTGGHARLKSALSRLYSQQLGRSIDPQVNINIGLGAQGCLLNAINGYVRPGDEVIIIEPFFDVYASHVLTAGGKPVYITLRPPPAAVAGCGQRLSAADWRLDSKEVAEAFSDRTRMLILCSPHNPTGKVLAGDELQQLCQLCKQFNVICLSDEVYETLVYTNNGIATRVAAQPGMWDRTITIGSAGKSFNVTGWRIGWSLGPEQLISATTAVQADTLYSVPTPLQDAMARAVQLQLSAACYEESVFGVIRRWVEQCKERLIDVLIRKGATVYEPEGGYFLLARLPIPSNDAANEKVDVDESTDKKIARELLVTYGLLTLPISKFYSATVGKAFTDGCVRFCFNRSKATIDAAIAALEKLPDPS